MRQRPTSPSRTRLARIYGRLLAGCQVPQFHRLVGGRRGERLAVGREHHLPDEAVVGAGSIHHIAFRVPDDATQLEYQAFLRAAGYDVTPVRDRSYFHSIYFREPGGILFEIATNTPGFAIDEPVETLGETLRLPEWFESSRRQIEAGLSPITLKPISSGS